MTGPEKSRDFGDFPQRSAEAVFLRREFGLVKVDSLPSQGLYSLAHISEFDGWAVEKESFLGRWLEFSPVKRLSGIHQLGLNRYFPLPNNHTRFDHSAEVALRTTLVLSRLARDFREGFLALSQHYPLNLDSQLSGREREEEQINKTIRLGAIYAANHDVATPAGGDAVKYIVGSDENHDLPMVLDWHRKDFAKLCQKDGFNPEEVIEFFVKLAQRKDEGILGQLIHCSGGKDRGFDLDSICYTLIDAQACLGLSSIQQNSRSSKVIPQEELAIQSELEKTASYLDKQQKELNQGAEVWLRGYEREVRQCYELNSSFPYVDLPFLRPQRPAQSLNLEDFSLFESLALKDGKVVFTDFQKLNNLYLLANFLAQNIYFSPTTLGSEVGLATSIEFNRGQKLLLDTEKHYLLNTDDHSFLENLKKNFPNWAYWFSDLASLGWEGSNLGQGGMPEVSIDTNSIFEAQRSYPENLLRIRKIPSRLNTRVMTSGEIKEYGEIFPGREKEIKRKLELQTMLIGTMPYWARPRLLVPAEEYATWSDRHLLEKMPYW
ncbi:MAG: hypothetical protein HW400_353 [Candidatus Levybacteria bacterium]|nr:hypothetical protein [Candidatus Levybacteria bacterium]